MKNSTRFNNPQSNRYLINYKLQRLQELLRDEISFGVPCYEEGTLSPKTGLEEIFKQVLEIEDVFNNREDVSRNQPPATPEALDDISEAVE